MSRGYHYSMSSLPPPHKSQHAPAEAMRERIMGVSEPRKGKRRFFAITSLNRSRWYWVVWPSLGELQASKEPLLHTGEGYEKTKAEAVERALELAGTDAERIAAKYAKAYHRSKADTSRKGARHRITEPPDTPVAQGFLYRDVRDAMTRHWDSVPHRVVRITRKYVYVEQHPYSPDDLTGSWLDQERPTFRLDRQALEQEGYAFIPATATIADTEEPMFFTRPRHKCVGWYGRQLPKCLGVLGLSWPCTVTDVKEAYRRLVKRAHPDGGGNHDKFLALQEAYEQALRMSL